MLFGEMNFRLLPPSKTGQEFQPYTDTPLEDWEAENPSYQRLYKLCYPGGEPACTAIGAQGSAGMKQDWIDKAYSLPCIQCMREMRHVLINEIKQDSYSTYAL